MARFMGGPACPQTGSSAQSAGAGPDSPRRTAPARAPGPPHRPGPTPQGLPRLPPTGLPQECARASAPGPVPPAPVRPAPHTESGTPLPDTESRPAPAHRVQHPESSTPHPAPRRASAPPHPCPRRHGLPHPYRASGARSGAGPPAPRPAMSHCTAGSPDGGRRAAPRRGTVRSPSSPRRSSRTGLAPMQVAHDTEVGAVPVRRDRGGVRQPAGRPRRRPWPPLPRPPAPRRPRRSGTRPPQERRQEVLVALLRHPHPPHRARVRRGHVGEAVDPAQHGLPRHCSLVSPHASIRTSPGCGSVLCPAASSRNRPGSGGSGTRQRR